MSLLVLAAVENSGPAYMLNAAKAELALLDDDAAKVPLFKIAQARLALFEGDTDSALEEIKPVLELPNVPFDAYVVHGQILLAEQKVAHARRTLRKALHLAPDNPRVLCLLAHSYLIPGPLYESEYACQLATAAAQNSSWLSPWAMHILAEAYYHCGDNMSALILAGKAKEVGSQRLGNYRDAVSLDMLIESLSSVENVSKQE
ncbi:MAG: hypothetical protein KDD62_04750 [Bdellovibrionales bacterium]|nr:hypothetical protein [Bdellovibrionales bacterium]